MKKLISLLFLGILTTLLLGCSGQDIHKNDTTPKNHTNSVDEDSSMTCGLGEAWGCRKVIRGEYDPENPPATVCGCVPECEYPKYLIVSDAHEYWEDGSKKGLFECSESIPN